VSGGIGFLGQNLVFAELVFPHRQSTCCELSVAPFSVYSIHFVQSASFGLGVIARFWRIKLLCDDKRCSETRT